MRAPILLLALAVAIAGGTGCGGGPAADEAGVLDRETFVETWLDLRIAALRNDGVLPLRRKESILADHGVTEEELRTFAEVHGGDPAYMLEVWNEVDQHLDSVGSRARDGGR